jgi:parallel beta-helix repeat protein
MKNKKTYVATILAVPLFSAVLIFGGAPVFADEYETQSPGMLGVAEGSGKHFTITNSEYLNVSLESDEDVDLRLESVPNTIVIKIQASTAASSAEIKLDGMDPNTTYHKYEDNYHNYAPVSTDENGAFYFKQDISKEHLIFIQPKKSTKFIKDDATGGNCTSIGNWDMGSKTCSLNKDVNETVQLSDDGIILEGNGHKVTGTGTGNGIYVYGKNSIVKNVVVSGFTYGIRMANEGSVISSTVSGNYYGIYVYGSNENLLSTNIINNTVSNNKNFGICIYYGKNNDISGNTVGPQNGSGLILALSDGNNFANNVFFDNTNGLNIKGEFNTLLNNTVRTNSTANFYIESIDMATNNIGVDNTIDGRPIYYEKNISEKTYDDSINAGAFYCISCHNITLKNISLSEKRAQMIFWHTDNSLVEGLSSADESSDIGLYYSSNNTIKKNIFNSVKIRKSSNYNKIYNNNIMTDDFGYTVVSSSIGNSFNEALPIGGNYWRSYEGCKDLNGDDICDSTYFFYGGWDNFPWVQKTDFNAPSGPSNVLFLPGLEGSRLYEGEEKMWEPEENWDISGLYLDSNGSSINNIRTKNGDVIDKFMDSLAIYDSFIKKLGFLDNEGIINDWNAYAYDWRMPLDKILEDGSLENKLRELAANSKSKKVTIVAHSNGGLLTKAFLQKMGNEETKKLVDKVILVAVPQVGTPSAVSAMLHGYKQHILPFMTNGEARNLAVNMSSAYNLLPSEGYFSTIQIPVIVFDEEKCSADWNVRYDQELKTKDALDDFLVDDFRRSLMFSSTLDVPMELNRILLEKANEQHDLLDSWNAPEGVKIVEIAGWGVPKTISAIKYRSVIGKLCNSICQYGLDVLDPEEFNSTIDGDGTVVTPSALWMGDGAERYWVNVENYNKNHRLETFYGIFGVDHKNILEIPELNNFIADNITNSAKPLSEYEYLSTEVPPSNDERRLQYTLHSPLTLNLYDTQEHHTGINQNGYIEEEIPGTYYSEIGETKSIFTSDEFPSRIEMKGYNEGKFTFSVKEYQGDEEKGKITFKDMPTTPETKVYFNVPNDLASASNLEIDKDGDGDIDYSLEPKIGEIVTLDTTPPITDPILLGTNGENGWYISDVSLTLAAKDEEKGSGLQKTEYSIDNGIAWTTYANPIIFSQEGITQVQYRSTDKQGNIEEAKTITIKIDKTAPEAKISFGKDNKKISITGIGNLSQNVSVVTEEKIIKEPTERHNGWNLWSWNWLPKNDNKKTMTTATLTDESGHKTEIVLEKKKDRNGFIDASLKSVSYDGQKNDSDKNGLQYKWILNRWRNEYSAFASHVKTESTILESHYLPKLNETWLMERPRELPDDERDDINRRPVRKKMPGMVIPGIIINKGELQVNY